MMTLGELLRKTREENGLTIAESAYQTKIREHYLAALEDNQLSSLPSAVQGKGYLRLYAQFLGLEEKPLIDAWNHPEHVVSEITALLPEEVIPETDLVSKVEEDLESEIYSDDQPDVADQIIEEDLDSFEKSEKIIHGDEVQHNKDLDKELVSISKTPLSDKIFNSIGKELNLQRTQLNLSFSEIEQFTNIRTYYLEVLENGNLEKLPSIPQAKGMLNNYATFLNLDVDKIMVEFAEGLQTRRNENYAPHKIGSDNQLAYQVPEVKKVGWLKFITVDLILTTVLIVGLLIFIIWGAVNISGIQDQDEVIDAPSISEILLENTPESTEEVLAEIIDEETTETVSQNTDSQDIATNEVPDEEPSENTPDEAGPVQSGDPVQVYIIARQRAYLKIDVDGETVFTGRVVPGNAYEYSGEISIELLTGNAAGLEIFYNLNPIGAIGEVGEVKSLIFTSSTGMVTPTPRFSPSPTSIQQLSPTPSPTATPTIAPPTPTPTVTQLIP